MTHLPGQWLQFQANQNRNLEYGGRRRGFNTKHRSTDVSRVVRIDTPQRLAAVRWRAEKGRLKCCEKLSHGGWLKTRPKSSLEWLNHSKFARQWEQSPGCAKAKCRALMPLPSKVCAHKTVNARFYLSGWTIKHQAPLPSKILSSFLQLTQILLFDAVVVTFCGSLPDVLAAHLQT